MLPLERIQKHSKVTDEIRAKELNQESLTIAPGAIFQTTRSQIISLAECVQMASVSQDPSFLAEGNSRGRTTNVRFRPVVAQENAELTTLCLSGVRTM